jgi:glutamine synthetase
VGADAPRLELRQSHRGLPRRREGPSLRIECRIPGRGLQSVPRVRARARLGLDGIEKRIEPPPIFAGDIYAADKLPLVPRTLREATATLTPGVRSPGARSAPT